MAMSVSGRAAASTLAEAVVQQRYGAIRQEPWDTRREHRLADPADRVDDHRAFVSSHDRPNQGGLLFAGNRVVYRLDQALVRETDGLRWSSAPEGRAILVITGVVCGLGERLVVDELLELRRPIEVGIWQVAAHFLEQ